MSDWRPAEGFKLLLDPFSLGYPEGFSRNQIYEWDRPEWDHPSEFKLSDQHPLFNVAGLYYRELPYA